MAAAGSKRHAPQAAGCSSSARRRVSQEDPVEVFIQVLALADCTVFAGGDAPVLGSGDARHLQMQLSRSLGADSKLHDKFILGFQAHIEDETNLRRVLKPITSSNRGFVMESLARVLLTVWSTQVLVANILLEKLPEYFSYSGSTPLMDCIPRMILAQFRWLDYLVDSESITQKLLDILSICPLNLKKEIISFLPELVSDADHETVMTSLEQMLQEDSQILVPVLDALSNLNLDKCLHDQVVEIALTSLRSTDAEDLPLVVRFLLQSSTAENARRITHYLRENLNFVAIADVRATRADPKLKGKSNSVNCEALVLDALRSGLRFKNIISEAFVKEIRNVEGERHHKVVDIWTLLILHANGGPHRKTAELLLKRKVLNRDFTAAIIRQCINGHGNSLQDYFPAFICFCESMLRSKEPLCLDFGLKMYISIFEEFTSAYHRQEVLGSLVTHTGSGIADEVSTALRTLVVLAENHPRDLLPMSSFINVILDYLESFPTECLHQVYKVFSHLAMSCWSSRGAFSHSSVADELLIFIRKQVANPELRYKHMGIIGVVNLMSCFGVQNAQETAAEPIRLLQMTLEMCKTSCMARGFFYDELAAHLEKKSTHLSIIEWAGKHTNEFESLFLGDLEGGRSNVQFHHELLEGNLWMNLDGDASPVFLNLFPLLMSYEQSMSSSLLFLPSYFRLLAATERSVNQGLLGGIDALLGCPICLPNATALRGNSWLKLSRRQKELSCIAIFYAINWIRELINAFSEASTEGLSQAVVDDTVAKLVNRIRHLLTLEHLLPECLKAVPHLALPQLHCFCSSQDSYKVEASSTADGNCRKSKKTKAKGEAGNHSQARPQSSQTGEKLRQGTILEAFGSGAGKSSEEPRSHSQSSQVREPTQNKADGAELFTSVESLGLQQWKLRPLTLPTLNLLMTSQNVNSTCCADPTAKLPVYLFLMRDLHYKLHSCSRKATPLNLRFPVSTCPKAPSGLRNASSADILATLSILFPSIRFHLDMAVSVLTEAGEKQAADCSSHWSSVSRAAGTPEVLDFNPSKLGTAKSFLYVTFCCLDKILQLPELKTQTTVVKDILMAFRSEETIDQAFPDLHIQLPLNSLDYLACLTYEYFDKIFDAVVQASHTATTELVMMLQSFVDFWSVFEEEPVQRSEVSSYLSRRLSTSASKLLGHDWDIDESGKVWKNDVLQRLVRMMIQRSQSPIEMVKAISTDVMSQVPSKGGKCSIPGYPTLGPTTFVIWYRVQHEVVLDSFTKFVKKILLHNKLKSPGNNENAGNLLESAFQCISLHVCLVNYTKAHDKALVHAVALRYGGKFVDVFLKALEFLEAQYDTHRIVIKSMVLEMQKATRTIQTICSQAKGEKKMPVTSKVPAVKRSMERYVFSIKALLHKASNGATFWMGNLKHKDLQGNEIGSQIAADDDDENENETHAEDLEGDDVEEDAQQEEEISLGDDNA